MKLGLSRRSQAAAAITDINVTPLVDVCLVLVIIFMVIAPMAMQAAIEVAGSRKGAAKGESAVAQNVTVALDDKGKLSVNGRTVAREELEGAIAKALTKSKDRLVSVDASPKADVGRVVDVLDSAKQSGAKRVALLHR